MFMPMKNKIKKITVAQIKAVMAEQEIAIVKSLLKDGSIDKNDYNDRLKDIKEAFKGVRTMDELFVGLNYLGFDYGGSDAMDYLIRVLIKQPKK